MCYSCNRSSLLITSRLPLHNSGLVCQSKENFGENLNGLEDTEPEPEPDGPAHLGEQLADGWTLQLGDCHRHLLGEGQEYAAKRRRCSFRDHSRRRSEGAAGHGAVG